LGHP